MSFKDPIVYYLPLQFTPSFVAQKLLSMSRHKLIKQLDLDEELDDYDGGALYDNDENEGGIIPLPSLIVVDFADLLLRGRDQCRRSRYFSHGHLA